MIYQVTILNLFFFLMLYFIIVKSARNWAQLIEGEGWGAVAMLGLTAICMTGVAIDLLLQFIIYKLEAEHLVWINSIVGISLATFLYKHYRPISMNFRIKIPENYSGAVQMVFNAKMSNIKIKKNYWFFEEEIYLPEKRLVKLTRKIHKNTFKVIDIFTSAGKKGSPGISRIETINCQGRELQVVVLSANIPMDQFDFEKELQELKEKVILDCNSNRF